MTANENCADGTGSIDITIFTTSGPISYLWSNGATTEDLASLSAGTYTVTITDAITCVETISFTIINQTSGISITTMNTTKNMFKNLKK